LTILQSILLGIIQGLTEFIPVSSSAHLVITPYLLGWDIPDRVEFIFDVLVQLGTLVAVVIYFWKDLISIVRAFLTGIINKKPFEDPNARLGWFLILATIPAVLAGALLKKIVEQAFTSAIATALFLLVTAAFLITAERYGRKIKELDRLTWLDALIAGFFQAFALFPGVSRSGSTISGGMLRGLDRPAAARFSFLMSVPVMIGAGGLAIVDLIQLPDYLGQTIPLLTGFISSAVAGYLSIRWLLSFLSRRSLYGFAGYCILLSITVLIVVLIRSAG